MQTVNTQQGYNPPDLQLAVPNDVSCTNIKAIYEYVMRKAPGKARELFDDLPAQYSEIEEPQVHLTDENNWVTSELTVKIFENAKRLLNDPEVAYHIGFEQVVRRQYGYILKLFIYTLGSPFGVLKKINHINSQFNNTKVVETIYGSATRAVVRLHWRERSVISNDICRYNRGIYAAIPTIWNRPPATITEPFCKFEGDPYCQFNITFHASKNPIVRFFGMWGTKKSQLLTALEQIEDDKIALRKKYDEVNVLNMELADKLEKLKAINTASNLLVSRGNTDEILSTTMRSIIDVMQFDRAIVMLADEKKTKLEFKYASGADPEDVEKHLRDYQIPLTRDDNLLARVAMHGRPTMVNDAKTSGLKMTNRILANFDVSSFVICPLLASEGIIGILAADRYMSKKAIHQHDIDDLAIFANTIAETLHKAQLKEDVESSYLNTVQALVKAIEEKDAYTRGHSVRVADLSVQIGKTLGLSDRHLEYLRLGCLLHDVGKIGISEAIVRSPKPLTVPEFNRIKQHPAKGAEIAKPISFLKDYLHIIRNHHEHFDGTGYPDGLQGDDIPMEAQIACVADAYDAITSTRPYRKGSPPEEASRRILADSGTHFSPAIVDAFQTVYEDQILTGLLSLI